MSKRICEDCGRDMSYTESSRCRSVHSSCNGFAIEVDEDIPDIPHPHHNAKTVAVFKRTSMSTKEENKPLTLQECKDKVVVMKFNKTYKEFYLLSGFPDIIKINDEAAELYASQFRSTPPEQWIPVSERLPDKSLKYVDVYINKKGGYRFTNYSLPKDNELIKEDFELNKVTHWMPRPSPPGHKIDDNEKQ